MPDETPPRSAEASDRPGHSGSGAGDGAPLQTRAAFLANWDWESVISINRGTCARGGAQHGVNSETGGACAAEWNGSHRDERSLAETFDLLRSYHRKAPFLFFNGNTFAAIGRELVLALFSDMPTARRRELGSAVGHYIAGVLDRDAMTQMILSLCENAELCPACG